MAVVAAAKALLAEIVKRNETTKLQIEVLCVLSDTMQLLPSAAALQLYLEVHHQTDFTAIYTYMYDINVRSILLSA